MLKIICKWMKIIIIAARNSSLEEFIFMLALWILNCVKLCISTPLEAVFSGSATSYLIPLPCWHDFLRMKTSSFHPLCQRSSRSPNCQRGRTGAWTRPWTSSGKRPENGWWQQSVRRQYDRTLPRKAQTASKSTSLRLRPASESEPAAIIEENPDSLQTFIDTNTQTDLRWTHRRTTDAQRPIPRKRHNWWQEKCGDHRAPKQSRIMQIITLLPWDRNNIDRCLILLLLLLLLLTL